MNNRNLLRGLFLMLIALGFGAYSFEYKIGELSRAGPGLFPLMVSGVLFVLGLLTTVRAWLVDPVPMDYQVRNVLLVIVALVGFAVLSEYADMILGIVFLVFVSSLAGTSYSLQRNVVLSGGLIAIAFAFKYFLGLQLPLI